MPRVSSEQRAVRDDLVVTLWLLGPVLPRNGR